MAADAVVVWGDNSAGQTKAPAETESGVSALAEVIDFTVALKIDSTTAPALSGTQFTVTNAIRETGNFFD